VNPFQYAGQFTDTATGLSDMRARQYDPSTGAFLSLDPAGSSTLPASSPYAYASDEPLLYSDPSGLFSCGVCNSVESAVGAAADAVGSAVSTGINVAYSFTLQPMVQLAENGWSCATRQTHCAAAGFDLAQVALMFLPGGLETRDLGDRIVGGAYDREDVADLVSSRRERSTATGRRCAPAICPVRNLSCFYEDSGAA
jgi:RHS repeat-associated protein